MFFNHTQYLKGSNEAQVAYFAYCELVLTKLVPFYSGPINPYQRRRYFRFEEPVINYSHFQEFNDPLIDLYIDGVKVYQVINCSFEEFKEALLIGNSFYKTPVTWTGFPDRSGGKYIRKSHHKPKELSEQELSRKNWRLHKGFNKDYRRKNRSMYGKRKKVCKQISNRCHRAWERECLTQERFDDLTNFKNKLFFDPWDID